MVRFGDGRVYMSHNPLMFALCLYVSRISYEGSSLSTNILERFEIVATAIRSTNVDARFPCNETVINAGALESSPIGGLLGTHRAGNSQLFTPTSSYNPNLVITTVLPPQHRLLSCFINAIANKTQQG